MKDRSGSIRTSIQRQSGGQVTAAAEREAMLAEIARGRCVSSRGRLNPRGVKRKMGNFNVRHRGAALHQQHQPVPVPVLSI